MEAIPKVYPFSAIVGQERLKKALILNAINPAVGGVLIRGEKGTAKSTAVRALAALLPEIRVIGGCPFSCDPDNPSEWCERCRSLNPPLPLISRRVPVVTLPLNATEDRVVGSIDFERAIRSGERRFYPGVLAKAHRGILYIDEVNLLDDYIADLILDAAASGVNRVEREGISFSHPARFILVGTMNPEEGDIRPQLLDRFGLCVEVAGEEDVQHRVELMLRREEFDNNPEVFSKCFESENQSIAWSISSARELIAKVKMADHLRKFISDLSAENNVAGHRADIVMEQAAKALAALNGRLYVTIEDLKEVAPMVFIHRRRQAAELPPPRHPRPNDEKENERNEDPYNPSEDQSQSQPTTEVSHGPSKGMERDLELQAMEEKGQREEPSMGERATDYRAVLERVFEIGETFKVRRLSVPKDRTLRRGSGRRSRTRTAQKQGRYVRSSIRGDNTDVALDATLRAAAPYQLRRRKGSSSGSLAVHLTSEDVRHKVRERRIGNFLLFLVDASGSMGAQGRMTATKGAIMSLLLDAYQKRDRVAMVTFRRNEAEVKLPPTSSVDLAARLLRDLPVGGRTPLSAGLIKGYEVLRNVLLRDPTARPILMIITDGKANLSLGPKKPVEEALLIASRIAMDERIYPVVVDTEKKGIVRFGLAERLADIMQALYFRVEDLKAEDLVQIIKEVA